MKNIEWADLTINAVVGCPRGCPYCYAKKINDRFHFVEDFAEPKSFRNRLEKIYRIKNKKIFMNSMSDITYWSHWITRIVLETIKDNPKNKYYFLTKDLYFFEKCSSKIAPWIFDIITYKNVFVGLTVTTQQEWDSYIRNMSAFKLINIEPILEPIDLFKNYNPNKKLIKKIILGAETGNRKEKVIPKKEWIENIIKFCKEYNIELFLKENIKKYL
ncbi:DUF5131 family protein [Brachyspira pilosicoli]|uniref:DUF5131 family protein n=1 Tax=Brachyspira pilosicoli TaxID=52584 RepID=UPI0012F4C5C3|nr:DUF5131 family protein [Brachyspira pilosicoli]